MTNSSLTKTFFDKFGLFADAPDAVAKMRELVLRMAMRGKLVSQNLNEGNACDLLETIILKGTKTTERRYRTTRADRADDIEAPYLLPSNWTWTTLGTIAAWGSGSTPPRGNPELYNGQHTWLKSGELNDNKSLKGSSEQVSDAAIESGSFRRNQPGDILFAMYGATVGKVAILAEPAVTNQAVCGCTPCEGVSNYFLFHYLIAERQNFRDTSEGGAQPNFSKDKILTYPFPLPPLAEQKRIVAKVDELMALCDRLEAQQRDREQKHASLARASLARFAEAPTPANLEFLFHKSYAIPPADLRKSILTLAVQGKLVPQDPNDEQSAVVLTRLAAQGGNAKIRRSVPVEVRRPETLDLENIPESWCIESIARLLQLGAIFDLKDGNHGTNHPKVAEFTETGLPFITAAQVSDDGRIDYDGAYKVSGEVLKRLRVGFAKPNDVIYTHKGSVGRVAICDRECVLTPQTTYYRVNEEVLTSGFVRTYLLSPLFRDQVDLVKRQTTRDFVSINAQYNFFMRVPPLAEQRRIVAKVDELMALVDALESQLATARTTASRLLEAAVAELTAQE